MADEYSKPINRLVEAFRKLPGIGPRSARRMAWHIVESPYENAVELARALVHVRKSIRPCSICYNYTDSDPCEVCNDPARDRGFLCVVESPEDVAAFERAGGHPGVYHVLGGVIKPAGGVGPERIRVEELVRRVEKGGIREILLAVNPSTEGEATIMHIAGRLKGTGVKLTRPSLGIPAGADIDYLDNDTLAGIFRAKRDVE